MPAHRDRGPASSAGTSSQPSASIRSAELPTRNATLTLTRRRTAQVARRRVPVVVDVGEAVEAGVQLDERREVRAGRERGVGQLPSTPMTSVVTPWRTFGSWRGSARIISPEWRVEVDEPRRDDEAGRVDRSARPGHLLVRPELAEAAGVDGDVSRPTRRTGPVDDRATNDDDVGAGHGTALRFALRVGLWGRGAPDDPHDRRCGPSRPAGVENVPERRTSGAFPVIWSSGRSRSTEVGPGMPAPRSLGTWAVPTPADKCGVRAGNDPVARWDRETDQSTGARGERAASSCRSATSCGKRGSRPV